MIVVTGTKRSGTSMWMHLLIAAGLPHLGERFPGGWGELLRDANPDGFFESELMIGVNYRTNPHPLTGAYLAPQRTRELAVKIFVPGLVRSDVAFLDRVIATVRGWREYVASMRRLGVDPAALPPALEWWCNNFALIRDLAIRGYPAHVLSYDSLLADPARVAAEVLAWIGRGDPEAAARVVRPEQRQGPIREPDAALADGVDARHLEVFDELYAVIDAGRPLSASFIERLNAVDRELRPQVREHQAAVEAEAVADIFNRR
jgi:hypothetical protein